MRNWRYSTMNDEALIRAYGNGKVEAFDCLYRRHKNRLFAFLRRQCNNPAIAEELAADTWIAVIRQAAHYRPTARFTTWLFHIAHNRLIDHWRKHASHHSVLLDEVNEHLLACEDQSSLRLELEELQKTLNTLSKEQTLAIMLRIEGFSYAEIAEITNAKKETVKSRLRYAKRHLAVLAEATA